MRVGPLARTSLVSENSEGNRFVPCATVEDTGRPHGPTVRPLSAALYCP